MIVADIDGLAERLTARGVEVTWDDDFPGHRRFHTVDCHENRLEFLSPER
ncbi:hypothetical protein [Streptomyces sp. NBC_00691]